MRASSFHLFSPFANSKLSFVSSSTNGHTSNFHLYNENTVKRIRKILWASVFRLIFLVKLQNSTIFLFHVSMSMSLCVYVSVYPCVHMYLFLCVRVSMSPCLLVFMLPCLQCLHVYVFVFPCVRVYTCLLVSMLPCLQCLHVYVSMSQCPQSCLHDLVHVSMSSSMFPCPRPCCHGLVHDAMSSLIFYVLVHVSMSLPMLPCHRPNSEKNPSSAVFQKSTLRNPHWKHKTNWCTRQQLQFLSWKSKMETGNFRLVAANGNQKRKFVFLSQQAINVTWQLVFQQTCPSMPLHVPHQ